MKKYLKRKSTKDEEWNKAVKRFFTRRHQLTTLEEETIINISKTLV